MRLLIGIVIFAGWLVISIKWYVCGIKELCDTETVIAEDTNAKKEVSGNFVFYPESDKPIVNEQSYKTKDSLLQLITQSNGSKLEIVGLYYTNEKDNDLGIKRAKNVYAKMFESIDTSNILVGKQIKEPDKMIPEKLFRGVEFYVQKGVMVHFTNNKYKTDLTTEQVENLKKLVDKSKKYQKHIVIEGHTDNVGSEKYNLILSKKRAEWIKKEVLNYGIDEQNIEIKAKGEEYPIATNDNEEGKQQNRRTKIIIN